MPNQLIRCQEQDLFSDSMQSLLCDRCEVKQLALSQKEQAHFILADDFTLRSLHFDDEIIAAAKEADCETPEMQLKTDLVLMTVIEKSDMSVYSLCKKCSFIGQKSVILTRRFFRVDSPTYITCGEFVLRCCHNLLKVGKSSCNINIKY